MAGDEQAAVPSRGESLSPPRERPWLLPYNRKLRHLQGITIRNLALIDAPSRRHGKTIDDEAIPSTLKSPTKTLALRESRGLAHSRSSNDLKAREGLDKNSNGEAQRSSSPITPTRPTMRKGLRRRSTMEWSGATPLARQKKLEDITGDRMADTFFSLHIAGQEDPIYVSEVVERAMNPNFRFFDLESSGPSVTRLDKLTIKVWAKNQHTSGWQYLIEFTVQLRALQFVGRALGNFRHPLPPNCILFHMTDGIYTSFTDFPVRERIFSDALAPPKQHPDGRKLPTSSYDALMRLSTLDDCIQDAIATRDRLADEIETILQENHKGISTLEQVPEAQEQLKTVEGAVAAEKRRVESARRKRDELETNIAFRKQKMRAGAELQAKLDKDLLTERTTHQTLQEVTEQLQEDIRNQRRHVCEDLQKVFPIDPVPGKSLLFTIRGLTLPNAEFDDAKPEVASAALGYVAQIVSLLSPYLSVILPYPITVNGSTSTIDDPLAINTTKTPALRTYPLFMKGVVAYRFEYGVFLLNKNIEILLNSLGLKPVDIRHTLPNLKYLLFVATAGKGELPGRKAGGIRGLLRGEAGLERKGSMDSTATGSSVGELEDGESGKARVDARKANGHVGFAKQALQKQRGGLQGSRLREVG